MQEERKRGQRLFGGLLSTLSRKEPNNQNQRRQEVEKRQVEKEKARKEGDEERKRERLAKLRSVRIAEQGKWEEQAVCVSVGVAERLLRCWIDEDEAHEYESYGEIVEYEDKSEIGMCAVSLFCKNSLLIDTHSTTNHGNSYRNKKIASSNRSQISVSKSKTRSERSTANIRTSSLVKRAFYRNRTKLLTISWWVMLTLSLL